MADNIEKDSGLLYPLSNFVISTRVECGLGAGIGAVTSASLLYPLDTIKTWMQVGGIKMDRRGKIREALRFKGLSWTLLGGVPVSIVYFTLYELINSKINKYSEFLV